MIDLVLFRHSPELVRQAAQRRGHDTTFVKVIVDLDRRLREEIATVERLKAEKNGLTGEIALSSDRRASTERLRPHLQKLDEQIATLSKQIMEQQRHIDERLAEIPNLVDASVAEGTDERDNLIVRSWGTPPAFEFPPKPHWELGEALGILDFERASKLSGSRFSLLRGAGARLARALTSFFLDHAMQHEYIEIAPPALVTRNTMWSTGQLSKFADAMFRDDETDLFLIPTAEVPLTGMHRDEIFAVSTLPRKYVAATECFRKEAGAAGRDTRGLIRLHQFPKVELVWLTEPSKSFAALEELTKNAASLLEALELPHRIMVLCGGDLGFASAKTYDIEVWLPSQHTYREISSCSNCTDFQARRSAIRYRPSPQAKPEFVHTLNGSGLAVGRALVAILENGQQADGSIKLPAVLAPYMGTDLLRMEERN